MRLNLKQEIPQTVTILNKLNKKDSATGLDVWYKKTLYNCSWQVSAVETQTGTQTNVGAKIKVQIPEAQKIKYLPYNEWKQGNMDECFTISADDYVILGEVSEEITPNTLLNVVSKYEPNACKIRLFEDLTLKGFIASSFLEQYASMYYVEGV